MKLSIVHKLSLIIVFLVLFSVSAVAWVFYFKTSELLVNIALEEISINIKNAGARVQAHIAVQNKDILFLAHVPPVQGILRSIKNTKYDVSDKSTYQQWVKRQKLIFVSMLKTKPEYLKIRFIDIHGDEKIVVGREGEKITSLQADELQNKSHRTYFKETIKLSKNSVFLSEINLNREHGKISVPYREVIRSATPIYDELSGKVAGMLLITAEISQLLYAIQQDVKGVSSNIYITNDDGYYLLHPDVSKEYAFDLDKDYRVQQEFPQLEKLYSPKNKTSTSTLLPESIGGDYVVSFTKIPFDPNNPKRFIAIGMSELFDTIIKKQTGILENVIFIVLALMFVSILLALLFSFRMTRPIKQMIQAVDDYAHQRATVSSMPVNQNDEIGVLARSFDTMINQIEEAQLNLQHANKTLESRVAERTLDLDISERRQRAVVENMVDGLITIDNKGIIQSFNSAAMKLFGYELHEVMGQNIKMLMPDPYQSEHDGYLHNYHDSGEKKIIGIGREVEGLRKDGSTFPLELAVSEMLISGETVFTGVVRNITERKKTESLIADSEIRQRSIVENMVDGLITIDNKGIMQSFNSAAIKLFGYEANEVIGKNVKLLMPEPYRAEHDGYLHNYNDTGERKIIGIGREVEGLRKDGSTFPLELAVSELLINGEKIFTGVVRDITERKQMEKMKNEFISTVSHELRTPLTSIRGSLGLLVSGTVGDLPESANEMLKIASNNTERLLLLINDILDIQKIESGKMSFKFETIDLQSFIERAIEEHAEYGKQHGVTFVLTSMVENVKVFADKDRLMQVMGNLLSNAAKFSSEGDNVEISVATHQGDRLRISITDYGAGIPQEFQSELFERFTQSDSSDTRAKGGTGLGLSITKVIIEKHGGLIDYISKEGIGSTFYFELPELVSEVAASETVTHSLSSDTSACVLIVEDDPDVAALIRRMLAEAGFNSDIAYDANQAREFLAKRKNYYRLMTLDILLPDEDGLSLLASLRKDPVTKDLPVVVLSVKANEAKRGLSGGALDVVDWLSKPIDSKRLVDVVSSIASMNQLPRVLHVEDEKDVHTVVNEMLKDKCELVWTTTVAESRKLIKQGNIDLVLLDIGLPDGSGLDLIEDIEKMEPQPRVVIFSALDVSDEYADRVDTVLVKSKTNNKKLLQVLVSAMK